MKRRRRRITIRPYAYEIQWEGGTGAGLQPERSDMVTGLDIHTRAMVLDGQSFGAAGAYEKIGGTIVGLGPCMISRNSDY